MCWQIFLWNCVCFSSLWVVLRSCRRWRLKGERSWVCRRSLRTVLRWSGAWEQPHHQPLPWSSLNSSSSRKEDAGVAGYNMRAHNTCRNLHACTHVSIFYFPGALNTKLILKTNITHNTTSVCLMIQQKQNFPCTVYFWFVQDTVGTGKFWKEIY